ncbi:zinc finger CW-type PWWP domain protein 1 [Varanus komodoensis]|uniref:zinc finger CW-type PWWP domain protein 1 n=1 Tax=Varanus komodoensis TaxID=61221 RepID=UPI001CF7E461|nr:zinc finger CW-type PWWP domain protein 1 [Varanus komodoensis]
MLPEAEQECQLKTEKHSAPLVHKGREKNEKPEADNGGRKENRKGAPQKKVQGNARVVTDQEEMQEQEQEEEEADGGSDKCMAWVQCSYPTCQKWRRLSSDIDPSVLPEDWSCNQNTDLQYNNCNIAEETWSGSENEVVYAVYIPGSIVWAKQYGYPWWPGIVEADPDIGEYFLFSSQTDSLPSKYHVTFFGKTVTRAWISASLLRNFGETTVEGNGLAKLKSKGDKKNLEAALMMAKEAAQISIQERIRIFGFRSRFSRKEPPKDHKDVKAAAALVTCKPQAKRTQRPLDGNKNSAASSRSQNKLPPGAAVKKQDGGVSKKVSVHGSRKHKLTSEASTSLLKKSQRDIQPPKTAPVPKGSGKARRPHSDQKSFKKPFSVPQCRNIKAERASSCANSSTASIVSPSYASKKDSSNEAMAESKPMLSQGSVILEESNGVAAVEKDEEEIFSSQEMSVFAEEKDYSPEDFSLVLFEE